MPGQKNKVCKPIRSLYRLKQVSKQWYEMFDSIILFYDFQINGSDDCIYHKRFDGRYILSGLYVDDIFIISSNLDLIHDVKKFLSYYFDMKDLGEVDLILGMKIIRSSDSISQSQSHYI